MFFSKDISKGHGVVGIYRFDAIIVLIFWLVTGGWSLLFLRCLWNIHLRKRCVPASCKRGCSIRQILVWIPEYMYTVYVCVIYTWCSLQCGSALSWCCWRIEALHKVLNVEQTLLSLLVCSFLLAKNISFWVSQLYSMSSKIFPQPWGICRFSKI